LTINPDIIPFTRSIEGGRAYAQVCLTCGHILGIRARLDSDPAPSPADLSDLQVARLRFVQWRLHAECTAQVEDSNDDGSSPPRAA
jgi:hypothetical protein